MRIDRLFFGLIQRLSALRYNLGKNELAVLVFHEICFEGEATDKNLFTSKQTFEDFIAENKDRIVSLDETNIKSHQGKTYPKIVITFDDVYESAYLNAIPTLRKLNIPFTVFICPDLIGKPGYVTKEEMNDISNIEGCTVGFHLNHHVFTRKMKKDVFLDEINCDQFEKEFNINCSYFAFPYGSTYASKVSSSQKELLAHYNKTFSTIFAHMSLSTYSKRHHFLPRITYSERTKPAAEKHLKR